ncbi:MAG: hypothetical protein GY870_20970 [archaeon]|nr:hypothetical protein [archaeon]
MSLRLKASNSMGKKEKMKIKEVDIKLKNHINTIFLLGLKYIKISIENSQL